MYVYRLVLMLNVSGGGTSCTPPPLPKKNKNKSDLWSFFSCILELGQPGRAKLEGAAKCTHPSEQRWRRAAPPVDHGNSPVVGPWSGQGSAEHLRVCMCLCKCVYVTAYPRVPAGPRLCDVPRTILTLRVPCPSSPPLSNVPFPAKATCSCRQFALHVSSQ